MINRWARWLLLCLSGAAGLWLSLWIDHHRLLPVTAPVRDTFHSPATFVSRLAGDPEAGRKIFQAFCAVCHAEVPQIDVAAPRIRDRKAWRRLTGQGRAAMLMVTLHGAGAMPARGGCFECTDQQIDQAIDYIVKNSK